MAADGLAARLRQMPPVMHGVFDGARIADLPAALHRHGLPARPLFLERPQAAAAAAGPWLAELACDRWADGIADALRVLEDRPAAVFWSWPNGIDSLYRHLRGLNATRIPPDDMVLFRHWDPAVLAAVLPVLRPAQLARFMAAAPCVVLPATPGHGALTARRRPDLPPPEPGMLRLDAHQMEAIEATLEAAGPARLAAYLRRALPEATARMDDAALHAAIARSDRSAAALGIATEQGRGRWAFLMLATRGGVEHAPEVRRVLAAGDAPPDRQLARLMRLSAVYGGGLEP